MRQSNLFIATVILAAASLLFLFGLAALSPTATDTKEDATYSNRVVVPLKRPTFAFGNPVSGPADASVTIFSFGDYQCAPCASVDAALLQVRKDYPNDVRVIWKDMPNQAAHPLAMEAAEAARCAGDQGAFWEYHSLLMGQQESIDPKNFPLIATQLGLDRETFQSCITNKRSLPIVRRDIEEALRLGIDATPYLFINDRVVKGDAGLEQIRSYVDSEMAKAGKPQVRRDSP